MPESQPASPAPAAPGLRPGAFVVIAAQLAALLYVMHLYRIEEVHGLARLLPLLFAGFAVHAWLPRRLRPAFFTLLSVAAFGVVLGAGMAARLVAAGLALIGLCHLPVPFWLRAGLVAAAGAMLACLRVGWPVEPHSGPLLLPLLGSMFMFRLIVYLYDLRHEKGPISPWQRLSYFFLLPNVCFPLFPVVDWSVFRRTYYDGDPAAIYQKGLQWMGRGVVQLVLYRAVYYYLASSPASATDAFGAALYMVSAYLLYLRVSGQFHLIVGILCLFGFNLPETHHLYYLASGFNDFWRRINIYWKDFVMKVFYYPVFMRLKKRGMTQALVLSTMITFVVSWLLHSYQWFWLRGTFPVHATDGVFWIGLGALVCWNSVREARAGRKRTLGKRAFAIGDAVRLALRTAGMFLLMSALWALWNGRSVAEFVSLLAVFARGPAWQWAALAGIVAAVAALGVLAQYVASRRPDLAAGGPFVPARSAYATGALVLVLLVPGLPAAQARLEPGAAAVAESLTRDRFNQRDKDLFDRGYYEALIGVEKYTSALWAARVEQPPDWKPLRATEAAVETGDILGFELRPQARITFKRATLEVNRWGMRDRDYEREKAPGTYRLAVVGASYVMGAGVGDDETFENVVEERLNAPAAAPGPVEVLNFGVAGYTLLEVAATVDRKVLGFAPDAILYMCHLNELSRASGAFARKAIAGVDLPYDGLRELQARAGITRGMDEAEAERRAEPLAEEILAWGYRSIVEKSRTAGAVPVWVFLPATDEALDAGRLERMTAIARDAGFLTWSLEGVYRGEDQMIQLAAWDKHPNSKGHRLIADALHALVVAHAPAIGLDRVTTIGQRGTGG